MFVITNYFYEFFIYFSDDESSTQCICSVKTGLLLFAFTPVDSPAAFGETQGEHLILLYNSCIL